MVRSTLLHFFFSGGPSGSKFRNYEITVTSIVFLKIYDYINRAFSVILFDNLDDYMYFQNTGQNP